MTKSNKYLKFLFVFLFLFMVFGLAACDNADKKAAQAVDSAIEALPAEVTLADEEAILSAREEYDKLTDKQKELVTKLEILESKESELQDLKDIKAVEDLIAAIPETVTLADQAKIQAARTAYNALSSALQSRVSNLEDLEDAEEAYQELVASQQAVDAVIDLIDDLPDAEDATLDDEEDVNDAKAAFDALKENEKEQVTNVDKLNALIAKIAQLKADQEDRDAAEAVDLMIALLPVLVQLADKELVEEARAAYDALTETQKALITGLDKLEAAETRIVDLEAAKVVIDMIAALPETLALDDEDDVIAAREAYEALSEVRKSMVTNLDLLRAKEEELEILKNPDLAVLNPLIKQIPDQIIDDFTFPTAEGVTWSYKDGEDDSLFDLEAGILLKTSFETALRTIEVSYGETTLELVINFGVVKEDFTPIFYVGGAAADKPAEGNNWDGYGTWDKQLAKTGFGGYLIEYGNKVYFISKDAFIPLVGTEENEHLDRETLRPLGMNGQDSRNNLGLINGIPTEYAGTAALYYNAGDVPIKFYGCDTYGRVNAVFAGYGKVVFSRQEDGSYKVGPMIPDHGGGDDVGTKEGSYIITLNPGDYLWTPHTWETDYNNSGFGTRLCSAQGVLTENSPITVKKFKFVQEFEVEYNLDGGTNNPGNPAKIKNYELPFTLKDPVKEGYKFLGWYTKADFSGDPVEKLEELTGKVKLYAKWEAIDYDITYELDGGENDPDNPDKYNIAELPLTLKDPVKEGYNFLGWFDNADFAGDPLEQLEGVSGDITLYAKWEETEYTITYETNGGAFVYPTKQEMIEAFLRDFYDFVSPEESLSDFMHGAGETSGYDGTWHSSHKAKIYAGARPTEVNEDYFISSAKYMEKWLPFFDMMDEFVKINPAQSFWGGTWTGNIRIRE
ncbi:MAG: InlB B-repeat-containing protein, partial [Bacilli bacterium]